MGLPYERRSLGTPRYKKYYNIQAQLDRGFLHPGGRSATEKLLTLLPHFGEESILMEIGCGTGHTALLVLEHFPCSYVGIDAAPKMLRRARSRLKRFASRITLLECDLQSHDLPVSSETLDVVISESVVAILDSRKILHDCHRVLKKGGILGWNDRIWGNKISLEDRRLLNSISKKVYGFDAAPEDLATVSDWREIVEGVGFKLVATEPIKTSKSESQKRASFISWLINLSRVLLKPNTSITLLQDKRIARRFAKHWEKMENWIFVAQKT